MELERLLNPNEVAHLFGRHRSTIDRYAILNKIDSRYGLPGIRVGGGWRFRISDVRRGLKEGIRLPGRRGRPRKTA